MKCRMIGELYDKSHRLESSSQVNWRAIINNSLETEQVWKIS